MLKLTLCELYIVRNRYIGLLVSDPTQRIDYTWIGFCMRFRLRNFEITNIHVCCESMRFPRGGGVQGNFLFSGGGGLGFKTYFRYVLPCRFKKRCVNINNKMCWRFTELLRFDRGIEVVNYPLPYIYKIGFQVFV